MLSKDEFVSRAGAGNFSDDENLIDVAFEGIHVDGEPIIDIFYACGSFDNMKLDFGGGVYAITCRDVLYACDKESRILRDMLGLRNTKQNNALCIELIEICENEIKNSGYIF